MKTWSVHMFSLLLLIPLSAFSQTLDQKADSILALMTTQQKINQLINNGFMTTPANTTLNIPGFVMADGPHGYRFGKATAFPVGISMTATWDKDLWYRIGCAMGHEFRGYGAGVQLGPCIDLCRDPRNGRSAESAGEDPFLASRIAENLVKGIQTTPVLATVKHYNCVNRQNNRFNNNEIVSEERLMSHYGLNFRRAIQEGGSFSLMSTYDIVNNIHASDNKFLLDTIVRQRWGFPFFMMSDWGSILSSKMAIQATTDVCMGADNYKNDLLNLLNAGSITIEDINKAVRNVLKTKFMSGMFDHYPGGNNLEVNSKEHQQIAYEAAQKTIILLKNTNNILPLNKAANKKIALIGPSANKAQLDGFGSSWVNPPYAVSPKQGIEAKIGTTNITYAFGCPIKTYDTSGFAAARIIAGQSDYVIFIGGLDDTMEGEGYDIGGDRKNFKVELPDQQQQLINELAKVNPNLIVVLESGGICAVPSCIYNIKGFLYAFYPGMEGGNAIADVLFGDYNPGGKLPVTMPVNNAQMPAWNDNFNDDYNCGYRYYNELNLTPQYPFGYGLSYTSFTYSNLQISAVDVPLGDDVTVSADVTNSGSRDGDEVVQLYLSDLNATIWVPEKELKGFERVALKAGETKTVTFKIGSEDYYLFDINTDKYIVEPGSFKVQIGGSSVNLPLSVTFNLVDGSRKPDLKILNIYSIPRYPVAGEKVTFLATVKNYGTQASPAGTVHKVLFKVNNVDVTWSVNYTKSIPAGGMAMICANDGIYDKNTWLASDTGTFNVTAVFDPDNIIMEHNEGNNKLTTALVVSDFSQTNICLNKPVWVSSIENAGLDGQYAVDGFETTRWSSAFKDKQWIIVNLLKKYDIKKIDLFWEAAYASEFYVLCGNDTTYLSDTIAHLTNATGGTCVWEPGNISAQYIKVYCVKRATVYGNSLFEIKAYGNQTNGNSISDEGKLNNIVIFPNPASDNITVSLPEVEKCVISIFNLEGKLIQRGSYEDKNININIKFLNTGLYFLRMELKSGLLTEKFIKF
ncbi:MAG: glycoside hydrolase family 3 C-terminal domain-containing protein [Bacteroidota bacterium]